MTLARPLPNGQTDLILRLEANPTGTAVDKIVGVTSVLERTLDRGTVVYGLRALSRLGVDKSELEPIARRFNGRLTQLTEPGKIFHRRDPPYITSYVVEYSPENFERVYLTGILP